MRADTAGLGAGIDPRTVLIMRNPPWALPIAYPLGFLPLRFAGLLWTLLLLACLLISVHMLHQLYGSPANRIHWLGVAFTPAIICITMGQTSLFALLGLVLFLRFHRCHPFAAGAALWLCALKPHLFLPFAAVLALWIVVSRSYKLLAGFLFALALTTAAAFLIDPTAWPAYAHLMRSPSVENQFIPCLAGSLRHLLRPHAVWLQYLPAALACLWALIYFIGVVALIGTGSPTPAPSSSSRFSPLHTHGFMTNASPYPRSSMAPMPPAPASSWPTLAFLILAADLELCFVKVTSTLFLWTIPAWFAWYLLAGAHRCRPQKRVRPSYGLLCANPAPPRGASA